MSNRRHKTGRSFLTALLLLPLWFFSVDAQAGTTEADLAVGIKTLPLLNNKMSGTVELAIIYDPADGTSNQEAASIKNLLGSGLEVPGGVKLVGVLVPVSSLDRLANSKFAILTGGLKRHYAAISSAVAGRGTLTMSTDLSCVQANQCVLGIVSKPKVEIYYSKAAANNAKVSFGQVFTMLAKEI